MDDTILSAIDNYYKLKQKYEKKLLNERKRIFNNNNLTKKEKKNKLNELKKCINCGKRGGTIFTNENRILSAKCGNMEEPCNLNIQINRGNYYNVYNLFVKYNKQFSNLRDSILKLKLDFIFKYKNEDETNDKFIKLKKEIKNTEKQLENIKELYYNIVNNSNNQYKLNLYNNNLNNEIKELLVLNKQYNETNDEDYLREIINKYCDVLLPLLNNIRNIKYKTNIVELDDIDNKYYLIQDLYSSKDMEVILDNKPKIITQKL
jgi:hypothetical protein